MSLLAWVITALSLAIVALFAYCAWWIATDYREGAQQRLREAERAEWRTQMLAKIRAAEAVIPARGTAPNRYLADETGRPE